MKGGERCLLAVLLVLGTSALPQSVQTSKPTIRHHRVEVTDDQYPPELRQAEDAIDKKDYAPAEKLLSTLTAKDPKNYRAWFDLGLVQHTQGRADDAVASYRKAVAAKPDVFESNLNLGLMLARAKNPEAASFLRAATKLKPSDNAEDALGRAWLSLARVLESDKPEEAIGAYREAIRLQPNEAEIHLSLGSVLQSRNDAKGAEEEFQRALALTSHANDPAATDLAGQATTALANLYMEQKRFADAEAMLRKLASVPGNDAVHKQLGRVLAAEGKYDEAAAEMAEGIKVAPNDASAVRDLADVYLLAKKNAEAEPLYRQLLQANPNDADLHHSLGRTLLDQHKFPEAQAEFVAAIKLKPNFGEAYGDLAAAADQNKDYGVVVPALDARDKILGARPFGYFLRATAYDHLRDRKNAALQYHKFLETADGKFPDQEWQAKHRLIAIEPKR